MGTILIIAGIVTACLFVLFLFFLAYLYIGTVVLARNGDVITGYDELGVIFMWPIYLVYWIPRYKRERRKLC